MAEKTEARIALEKRAAELKLSFPANIGDKKLGERIAKAESQNSASNAITTPQVANDAETEGAVGSTASAASGSGEAFLTVTGPKKGFWRAGIRFDGTPRAFGPGDLTPEQIEAIEAEPKLSVTKGATPTE